MNEREDFIVRAVDAYIADVESGKYGGEEDRVVVAAFRKAMADLREALD